MWGWSYRVEIIGVYDYSYGIMENHIVNIEVTVLVFVGRSFYALKVKINVLLISKLSNECRPEE